MKQTSEHFPKTESFGIPVSLTFNKALFFTVKSYKKPRFLSIRKFPGEFSRVTDLMMAIFKESDPCVRILLPQGPRRQKSIPAHNFKHVLDSRRVRDRAPRGLERIEIML
jgi:hypothetical protein